LDTGCRTCVWKENQAFAKRAQSLEKTDNATVPETRIPSLHKGSQKVGTFLCQKRGSQGGGRLYKSARKRSLFNAMPRNRVKPSKVESGLSAIQLSTPPSCVQSPLHCACRTLDTEQCSTCGPTPTLVCLTPWFVDLTSTRR